MGIIISIDLKPSKQCLKVEIRANKILGFIGKAYEFKSKEINPTLYNSLVHPLLEYYDHFGHPTSKKTWNGESAASSYKDDSQAEKQIP